MYYVLLHVFTALSLSLFVSTIGVYNQFDTIVYPKLFKENQKDLGSIGAIGDAIGEFLRRSLPLRSDYDELKNNALEMSSFSLSMYLDGFKLKFSAGRLDKSFSFHECYCEIKHILCCVSTINALPPRQYQRRESKQNYEKLKEVKFNNSHLIIAPTMTWQMLYMCMCTFSLTDYPC